jgi:hypothetical protein
MAFNHKPFKGFWVDHTENEARREVTSEQQFRKQLKGM